MRVVSGRRTTWRDSWRWRAAALHELLTWPLQSDELNHESKGPSTDREATTERSASSAEGGPAGWCVLPRRLFNRVRVFKACIAKQVRRHDFPDKATVEKSWKHDLKELAKTAGLEKALKDEIKNNPQFSANWGVVKEWNEASRYSAATTMIEARDMIRAVSARTNGVLQWITQRW